MDEVYRKNSLQDRRCRKRAAQRTCALCHLKFFARGEITGRFGAKTRRVQKYCSWTCSSQRGKIIRTCIYCHKTIITYKSFNKKYCDVNCRNIDYRKRLAGSASHFWEGGKTSFNKILRSRSEYSEWRKSVFKRDNFTCQKCGKLGCVLNADHIKPISERPDLVYDLSNGRTLCVPCHKATPTFGPKQRWKNTMTLSLCAGKSLQVNSRLKRRSKMPRPNNMFLDTKRILDFVNRVEKKKGYKRDASLIVRHLFEEVAEVSAELHFMEYVATSGLRSGSGRKVSEALVDVVFLAAYLSDVVGADLDSSFSTRMRQVAAKYGVDCPEAE